VPRRVAQLRMARRRRRRCLAVGWRGGWWPPLPGPDLGPSGPHLGLGGPAAGMAVLPPAAGGVDRAWGGLDGDASTAARRCELNEPAGSAGPGGTGLLICCVRSITVFGGGGRALLRVGCSAAPRSRLSPLDPSVSLLWSWLDGGDDCKFVVARAGGR
jgi:hypothetical protein